MNFLKEFFCSSSKSGNGKTSFVLAKLNRSVLPYMTLFSL